jgi:2-hydroxy-3-keto-5-methylthiopentenyl-1-phosphate phosphatase
MAAVVVDFDGTACAVDVGDALCEQFSREGWRELDRAAREGHVTLRQAIDGQTRMLGASIDEMLAFVLGHFVVDPTFVSFAHWAEQRSVRVEVASDGLGFYVGPMLSAAGLSWIPIRANRVVETSGGLRMDHPHAHRTCAGCGTCKMLAIHDARSASGDVAFVGDGESDRFAAVFADVVFAKGRLAGLCEARGIPYEGWGDFRDVRRALVRRYDRTGSTPEKGRPPELCPGLTVQGWSAPGGMP